MLGYCSPNATICNWMRNKDTLEFLCLWEGLHKSSFKPLEFEGFRSQAGSNAFTMSPSKWINGVGAVGIVSKLILSNKWFIILNKEWRF